MNSHYNQSLHGLSVPQELRTSSQTKTSLKKTWRWQGSACWVLRQHVGCSDHQRVEKRGGFSKVLAGLPDHWNFPPWPQSIPRPLQRRWPWGWCWSEQGGASERGLDFPWGLPKEKLVCRNQIISQELNTSNKQKPDLKASVWKDKVRQAQDPACRLWPEHIARISLFNTNGPKNPKAKEVLSLFLFQ